MPPYSSARTRNATPASAHLEMQAWRRVAVVFFIDAIHLVGRYVPRAQLLRRHASPRLDIDALAALDTEETLRLARDRTDTLVHGIDEMDARYHGVVGTRHRMHVGACCAARSRC